MHVCMHVYVCTNTIDCIGQDFQHDGMCVAMYVKEREREREREGACVCEGVCTHVYVCRTQVDCIKKDFRHDVMCIGMYETEYFFAVCVQVCMRACAMCVCVLLHRMFKTVYARTYSA